MEAREMIAIRGLTKTFGTGSDAVTALRDIDLSVRAGEIFGIIGLSGAGKSTLVRCMNYLEHPTEGSVTVDGKKLGALNKKELLNARRGIGMIFQQFNLLMQKTALDNICFPLEIAGVSRKDAIDRARELLKLVDLEDREKAYPAQLSGGQKQRVAIARAIAAKPPVILADEPTGNIDPETSYQLVELLKEICDTGKTIIIATHQYDLIEKFPGRVFCCEHGELYEKTPAKACECTEEVLPLPPIEEIIPGPSSEAGTIAPPNTEEVPEDTTAVNSEPETATIVEVTSETVNLTEKPEQAASEIEDKKTTEDTTGDIMTLIGKLDYPEITAFDYELEHLPELKPEDQEVATEENTDIPEIQEELPEKKGKQNLPPALDVELID